MKYFILLICLFVVCSSAAGAEIEFQDWYGVYSAGVYPENGAKSIATYSGSGDVMLVVYIDEQDIFRIKFYPEKPITNVTFDHRTYRGMNFNSLYGYEHWITRMKKHYRLQVWFERKDRYEEFSLKGFYNAVNWLYK